MIFESESGFEEDEKMTELEIEKERLEEIKIGTVFDYFSKIRVIAARLNDALRIGDKIRVKGETTDFEQTVDSIQIDNKEVTEACAGEDVGIKVIEKARKNDKIFLSP
jgi:putative protease